MILTMIKSQEHTMSFVADSMERRTRKNTFYRKIDQIIDWKPIEDIITEHDTRGSSAVGRAAYPGLLLFKMLLLGMWNDLNRSFASGKTFYSIGEC